MLEVKNLCKSYETFSLKDVSFTLEKGYILGFIGANGAGKSTTMKAMLGLAKKDSGTVKFFGKNFEENENQIKQDVGFMIEAFDCYKNKRVKVIAKIYASFFPTWSEEEFENYLKKFEIDQNKKVRDLSQGMKVKLSLALALSHNAKLLILDEPTSGLDPIAREELLDVFRDIIADGEKSIMFSTHITSDLDKCADFIVLLSGGTVILNGEKDEILESHTLVKGKTSQLTGEICEKLVSHKDTTLGFTALVKKENLKKEWGLAEEKPNLEDLMVFYNRR